ncbi:NADH:ubiquinone oxidoreductase, NADH-binding (51 kD) subunit (plasmid) [Mycobacterium sp. JS623]|uniref:NADH-ubiquinone oxidoreductase-F iron-sulfur binding region domain-containing protein n=1 Tax=Mycobacterium sp. JS623 TaxID=212767 RepID=UPI0002A54EE1|nr:NADH-ubiquinone oxidoreductase-F iron-sulfur binding region domain-containing protein [Mycobacterium sp. JS623]AGB26808.1 NADH:ubiquinone oxidoreductase, NADH-binding (51 kD) subunit [Mycobacterium sp. JS623]
MTISRRPGAPTSQRLFAANGPGLVEHQQRFGALPDSAATTLVQVLDRSGLTGRGGAGFPTGRKIASVTGRKAVVIGNGAEGEPLSHKDAELLSRATHLVLDGLKLVAAAVSADKVVMYVPSGAIAPIKTAISERRSAKVDRHRVTVVAAPHGFVAGEESAAVRRVEGGPALPRDRTVPTSISGLRGRPTVVNNVETLAHIALIARYGSRWFTSVGDPSEPGTMLVTLTGGPTTDSVLEVPTGTRLTDLVRCTGVTDSGALRAVLLGGYHGTWIPGAMLTDARLSRAGLAHLGASPGAGIIHALPADQCGLARTADILGYLAGQSARQCGPCLNGLPQLARLFDDLAYGRVDEQLLEEVSRMIDIIDGRGSCRHPEGTARLARSALDTFASDIEHHRHGRCEGALAPMHATGRPPQHISGTR